MLLNHSNGRLEEDQTSDDGSDLATVDTSFQRSRRLKMDGHLRPIASLIFEKSSNIPTSIVFFQCLIEFYFVLMMKFVGVCLPLQNSTHRPNTTTLDTWIPPVLTVQLPNHCQSATSPTVPSPELPTYIDSAISLQVDIPPPAITTSDSPSVAAAPLVYPAPISAAAGPSSADNAAPGTTPPPPSDSSQQPSSSSSAPATPSKHHMITRAKNNIHKPIQKLNLHAHLHSSTNFQLA
ncbi:hypothetical protein LWI29_025112 [Acer saccharum]|uniref:Uncharacterized protein n=1 Tax=Acer saccharum TaxID=4024 RepID=A0AA39RML0_ACESA|nr:hypothetical protein LWI29_025112 [Acer saccharum]